jgi:hypothetical protein
MTEITRLPFKIGQPIDDVLYIAKRSYRRRLALELAGEEGTFVFMKAATRRANKEIEKRLEGLEVKLNQNFTVRYFYADCTLTFIQYRGLGGDGPRCYRISKIDDPIDPSTLPTFTPPSSRALPSQASHLTHAST